MIPSYLKHCFNIHPNRWGYWLIVAAFLRSIVWLTLYYNLPVVQRTDGVWGIFYDSGDSADYQKFAENLITHNRYALYLEKPISYAGRMPGWAAPYLAFRAFLSPAAALNAMQAMQMALSVLSIYALAWLCWLPSRRQLVFCTVLLVYAVLAYVAVFDVTHLAESLTLSSLILGVALSVKAGNEKGFRHNMLLIAGGVFLAWSVFLRPVMLIAVVVFLAALSFLSRAAIRKRIATIAAVALPLCLTLGAWVFRNYIVLQQFIPLTSTSWGGEVPPPHTAAIFRFVQNWGGDNTRWYPNAAIRYFDSMGVNLGDSSTVEIPAYAYCSAYTADSLQLVRGLCLKLSQTDLLKPGQESLSLAIAEKLNRYADAYQAEKPHEVYLLAPLRSMYRLLFQTGTYYLSSRSWMMEGFTGKLFKLMGAALYASLLFGFATTCIWVWLRPHAARVWVAVCAIFILLYLVVVCGVYHHSEYRLILPCLPVMLAAIAVSMPTQATVGQRPLNL